MPICGSIKECNPYDESVLGCTIAKPRREWDYELSGIQFDGDNYVRTGIFPYSEENVNKDFECVFNLDFTYSGSEKSFGVFSNFKTGLQNHPVEFWCTTLDKFTIWSVATKPSFETKSFSVPNLSGSDIYFRRRGGTYTVEINGQTIISFTVDALEDNDEIVVGAFRSSNRNNLYKSNDYLNYFKFRWIDPDLTGYLDEFVLDENTLA